MSLRGRIREHLDEPADKRGYVRDLFGRIAPRYDLTNDVMSLGLHRLWKRKLMELAEIEPGQTVLDLAAGTGDLALAARARVAPDGRVVAADLTPEMMAVGAGREGGRRIRWVTADALELPFEDSSFDRVVIGYGLRNFPDLERSLREIFRCLRPGGRLASLDFGKPSSRLLRRLYMGYLDASTAVVGWLLHRDPEAYLYIPESLRAYPAQDEVADLMHRAGFQHCVWTDVMFGTMALHVADRS